MSTFYPFNLKLGSPNNPVGFNPASVKDANSNKLLAQWGFGRGTTGTDEIYDKANTGDVRALQQGRSYLFDGTDDYLDCNDPIIDTFTDFTVSYWLKTTSVNNRIATIKRSGVSDDLIRMGINSGGGGFFEFDDGTVTNLGVGGADDGEWHHFCVTYDADGGSDNAKLYFDGVLRTTRTLANFDFSNTDSNFIIGARYTTSTLFYGGELFDFRLLDAELTADEVAYMASLGKIGTEPGSGTLWYKMDEQEGTNALDSSGNGNTGTITNATLSTFHATQDVYSYQNQVGYTQRMYFDGTDDYIAMGNVLDVSDKTTVFRCKFTVVIEKALDDFNYMVGKGLSPSVAGFAFRNGPSGSREYLSLFVGDSSLSDESRSATPVFTAAGKYEIDVTYNGDRTVTATVNGASVTMSDIDATDFGNFTNFSNTQEFCVGARGFDTGGPTRGSVYDVEFYVNGVLQSSWNGYGNTNIDWIDQTGSNNGTVNGSPSNILFPRDESDTANDALGNTLQYTGAAPQNPKLIDSNCITSDGTDDYIEIDDATAFDIADNLTVGLWAKNDNATIASNEFLVGRYDSGVSKREWAIGVDPNEKIVLNFGDPADGSFEATVSSDNAIAVDSWHHYAFTFEGGTVKVYLDGVRIPSSTTFGTTPSSLYASDIETTILAILASGSVNGPWEGNVCDVRIYCRDPAAKGAGGPLTDADILDWYQNGTVEFTDQTLAARYKLAEGAGATAFDSSGNGNHGALTNFALANAWGTDQDNFHGNINEGFSKRMYFDGTDDYISVSGMTAAVDYFGACTISAKVYIEDAAGDQVIFVLGTSAYRLFTSGGTYRFNSATDTGVSVAVGYHEISAEFNSSGQATSLTIDGVEEWTGTAPPGGLATTVFYLGARDSSGLGVFFQGSIWDFAITGSAVKNFSFNGYGNTNADWVDQVGSNSGTVNGSPSLLYIPSDNSNTSLDAAGGTLSNPSGNFHNGAETDINFNPATTPEMANIYTEAEGDGSADYLLAGATEALFDITDNLTVSCWAKNDSASVGTEYLVCKYDYGADEREWALTFFTGGKLAVNFGDPADGTFEGRWESDDAIASPDSWHHYAFTFDGGTVQLYVDGLPISGSVASGSIPSTLYNGVAALTVFTELNSGAVANPWDGNIQQVRIYSGSSAVLTDAQMLDVYNNPENNLAFSGQTLVTSYPLISNTLDYSGNNIHLQNRGVTLNKYTVPTDYSFGDSLGTQYNHFKREASSVKEDRFLLYKESLLHNSKLSKVEAYTA